MEKLVTVKMSVSAAEKVKLQAAMWSDKGLSPKIVGQPAAAIAALNDKAFLEQSARNNAAGYQQFIEAFTQLGLEFVPSHGNFVLVKVGDDDGAGARVNLALLKQGVIVRPVGSYGLPQWLRISIGLPQENAIFIAALTKALA